MTHIVAPTRIEPARLEGELPLDLVEAANRLIQSSRDRGDVAALLGVAPRTARATMKSLLDDGIVGSETPRSALLLRFPSKTHDVLFPRLFDLT